ncbi:TatD family hydrolase [Candidatus Saccharibacteria bacterium]|nr:TatD family hydrolase [Candidatus Saccharibacteria bacterium]
MDLIDTHCHLQFEKYRGQEDEVLAAAGRSGVNRLICVGTTLADSRQAAVLAKTKKGVWASAGVHPHAAAKFLDDPNGVKKLKKIALQPKVVAVGETGLDFYRLVSTRAEQEQALRKHIEVAIEIKLPLIFHVREAWKDFWRVFDSCKSAGRRIKGVVHSFSANSKQLDEVLNRGLYVGLNGIMTFSHDHSQLAAARAVPLDKLVLETDAPFLTPAPFRGELCEPRHALSIAEFLAKLRGENLGELTAATTANAEQLFGIKN